MLRHSTVRRESYAEPASLLCLGIVLCVDESYAEPASATDSGVMGHYVTHHRTHQLAPKEYVCYADYGLPAPMLQAKPRAQTHVCVLAPSEYVCTAD